MLLILARHGNTFAPDARVVWAGRKQDFPLVEKGHQQARALAKHLKENKCIPEVVYCSPLLRTRQYAQIVISEMDLALTPEVDHRLSEIDYGLWGGLDNQQIREQFGGDKLDAWNKRSIWPTDCDWGQSEEEIISETMSFLASLSSSTGSNQRVLVVTSNGRLRYFLKAVPGEFEKRVETEHFKVATGNYCKMIYENKKWQIEAWNQSSSDGGKE